MSLICVCEPRELLSRDYFCILAVRHSGWVNPANDRIHISSILVFEDYMNAVFFLFETREKWTERLKKQAKSYFTSPKGR